MAKAISEGLSLSKLAERFGCDVGTIRRVARERGLSLGGTSAESPKHAAPASGMARPPRPRVAPAQPRANACVPTYDTSFGEAIRDARVRAGLSQVDVASAIGTPNTHVSDVERLKARPYSLAKTLRAAQVLGLDDADLVYKWSLWREEVPLVRSGDERRDRVAAALAAKWETLSAASIERIAKVVGL